MTSYPSYSTTDTRRRHSHVCSLLAYTLEYPPWNSRQSHFGVPRNEMVDYHTTKVDVSHMCASYHIDVCIRESKRFQFCMRISSSRDLNPPTSSWDVSCAQGDILSPCHLWWMVRARGRSFLHQKSTTPCRAFGKFPTESWRRVGHTTYERFQLESTKERKCSFL